MMRQHNFKLVGISLSLGPIYHNGKAFLCPKALDIPLSEVLSLEWLVITMPPNKFFSMVGKIRSTTNQRQKQKMHNRFYGHLSKYVRK